MERVASFNPPSPDSPAMSTSTREILQEIIALANKHYAASTLPQPPIRDSFLFPPTDVPPLALSLITAELESRLTHANILPQIREITLKHARNLVSQYEASFEKALRKLLLTSTSKESAISGIDILRKTFEHSYEHKDVTKFFEKALAGDISMRSRIESPRQAVPHSSKPFNQAFLPFLEAYLEQNAFPSAADQKFMANKSGMSQAQIATWFQNHRSRARKNGREAELKRLTPGQSVNSELIEERIKAFNLVPKPDPHSEQTQNIVGNVLDELARPSSEFIPSTYTPASIGRCAVDTEAFGLPHVKNLQPPPTKRNQVTDEELGDMLSSIDIRTSIPSAPVAAPTRQKTPGSRRSSPKPVSMGRQLKATLRSCFSSAITLTCPRTHPALIPQKTTWAPSSAITGRSTVLEQKRAPVKPYTLPAVLPTWELPAADQPKRKKPCIPSHGGRMRPGSPYPQQTISRVSSSSSLSSVASNDSLWSSHTTSSDDSATSVESFATSTSSQSPISTYSDLADDAPFTNDLWGFYSNPVNDNFGFDIAVENPFDMNVSLSIADFDTTTLPTLEFFDS